MTGDRAAALVMELFEKSLIPSPADVFDALRTLQREAAGAAAKQACPGRCLHDGCQAVRAAIAKIEAL